MRESGKMLVWFMIGFIIAAALVYAYASGAIQSAFQQGYQLGYQQGLAAAPSAPEVVPPAELKITQEGSTFNLTAEILSDGSATNTTKVLNLVISNEDNRTANVIVTLKNPKTGEEGLPDALENAYFNVFAGSIIKKYLFVDGDYTTGLALEIEPKSVITIPIGVELEDAPAGTFADEQTYEMELYIYQPDANYVETITYKILT